MGLQDTLSALLLRGQEWSAIQPLRPAHLEQHLVPFQRFRQGLATTGPAGKALAPADLAAIRRRWSRANGRLDTLTQREIRSLCADPETAIDPNFVRAVGLRPETGERATWLAGLLQSYMQKWRRFQSPHVLEALLLHHLSNYAGRNPWLLRLKPVATDIVGPAAATQVAQSALSKRWSVGELLETLELSQESGLAEEARGELARVWAKEFDKSSQPPLALLDYLLQRVLVPPFPKPGFDALERAILSPWAEKSDDIRGRLREFVLRPEPLGDPRLPGSGAKWSRMSNAARDRVVSWLARETIRFFFETVLPRGHEGAARGRFWLRYANQIVDFRVALCARDHARLRSLNLDQIPQYSRTSSDQISAFIMKLAGARPLVVVEFSKVGNAAYAYQAGTFAALFPSIHIPSFDVPRLKNMRQNTFRIMHTTDWEPRATAQLAEHGVRPR